MSIGIGGLQPHLHQPAMTLKGPIAVPLRRVERDAEPGETSHVGSPLAPNLWERIAGQAVLDEASTKDLRARWVDRIGEFRLFFVAQQDLMWLTGRLGRTLPKIGRIRVKSGDIRTLIKMVLSSTT